MKVSRSCMKLQSCNEVSRSFKKILEVLWSVAKFHEVSHEVSKQKKLQKFQKLRSFIFTCGRLHIVDKTFLPSLEFKDFFTQNDLRAQGFPKQQSLSTLSGNFVKLRSFWSYKSLEVSFVEWSFTKFHEVAAIFTNFRDLIRNFSCVTKFLEAARNRSKQVEVVRNYSKFH